LLYQKLNHCRQAPGEPVQIYSDRFRNLCDQLSIDTESDKLGWQATTRITGGMSGSREKHNGHSRSRCARPMRARA
jgi:hypothetical protein